MAHHQNVHVKAHPQQDEAVFVFGVLREGVMSTVNISFNPDLLKQIDKAAAEESRSRSELLREAARSYIERKRRWGQIFRLGNQVARASGLTSTDMQKEIESFRKQKRK